MLPPTLTKAFLTNGLKHKSLIVKHTTMKLIRSLFHRFVAVCKGAVDTRGADDVLLAQFRESFRKQLPDMQVLFGLRSELHPKEVAKQKSVEHPDKAGDLCYSLLLDVMVCFQKTLPEVLLESRVDLWKFLDSDVACLPPLCQYRIVKLLKSGGAAGNRIWSRQKENNADQGQTLSNFGRLIHIYIETDGPVKDLVMNMCIGILETTGIFSRGDTDGILGSEAEMSIWLECLTEQSLVYFENLIDQAVHSHQDDSYRQFRSSYSGDVCLSPVLLYALDSAAGQREVHVLDYLYRVTLRLLHIGHPSSSFLANLSTRVSSVFKKVYRNQFEALRRLINAKKTPYLFGKSESRAVDKCSVGEVTSNLKGALESGTLAVQGILLQADTNFVGTLLSRVDKEAPSTVLRDFLLAFIENSLFELRSVKSCLAQPDSCPKLSEFLLTLPSSMLLAHAAADNFKHFENKPVRTLLLCSAQRSNSYCRTALLQLFMQDLVASLGAMKQDRGHLKRFDWACFCFERAFLDLIADAQAGSIAESELYLCVSACLAVLFKAEDHDVFLKLSTPGHSTLMLTVASIVNQLPTTTEHRDAGCSQLFQRLADEICSPFTNKEQFGQDTLPATLLLLRLFLERIPVSHKQKISSSLLSKAVTDGLVVDSYNKSISPRLQMALSLAKYYPLGRQLLPLSAELSTILLSSVIVQTESSSNPSVDRILSELVAGQGIPLPNTQQPHADLSIVVNKNTLEVCLKHPSATRGRIVASLLSGRFGPFFCDQFANFVVRELKTFRKSTDAVRNFLPAFVEYLSSVHVSYKVRTGAGDNHSKLTAWLGRFATESLVSLIAEDPTAVEPCCSILDALCKLSVLGVDRRKQIVHDTIASATGSKLSPQHVRVFEIVFGNGHDGLDGEIGAAVYTILKTLTGVLKPSATATDPSLEKSLCSILGALIFSQGMSLERLIQSSSTKREDFVKAVNRFIVNGLRYRLGDISMVRVIRQLVSINRDQLVEGVLPAHIVFDVVVSSATFIDMMLYPSQGKQFFPVSAINQSDPAMKRKVELLLLLKVLFSFPQDAPSRDTSSNDNLVRVLFATYQGTTARADVLTRDLIFLFQHEDQSGSEGMATCYHKWGKAGLNHLYAHIKETVSENDIGDGIDPDSSWVYENFDKRLLEKGAMSVEHKGSDDIRYDPEFMLPFVVNFLEERKVDIRKVIQLNLVSFVVSALSSEDEKLRSQAYNAMGLFFEMVDSLTADPSAEEKPGDRTRAGLLGVCHYLHIDRFARPP